MEIWFDWKFDDMIRWIGYKIMYISKLSKVRCVIMGIWVIYYEDWVVFI